MGLKNIIESCKEYVTNNKIEVLLHTTALATMFSDGVLTYNALNGIPDFEQYIPMRSLMKQLGVGPALLVDGTKQILGCGVLIGIGKKLQKREDEWKVGGNMLVYGVSSAVATIHTLGTLSDRMDLTTIIYYWNKLGNIIPFY
ncbi:hypothetical protein CL622_02580 [archaeon]|nr:hypothetical protein [archaeon]|tara:strand:+ start:166 stop:594 length:429 start_codon:yes stop_codon:yes gene_type:complete